MKNHGKHLMCLASEVIAWIVQKCTIFFFSLSYLTSFLPFEKYWQLYFFFFFCQDDIFCIGKNKGPSKFCFDINSSFLPTSEEVSFKEPRKLSDYLLMSPKCEHWGLLCLLHTSFFSAT